MIKKIVVGLLIMALFAGLGYFFLWPSDYRVSFNATTTAGTINQSLKSWNTQLKESEIIASSNLNKVQQEIRINDSLHRYTWSITQLNDSTQRIHMDVKDLEHSLANKWQVLFDDNPPIALLAKKHAKAFYTLLMDHLSRIRVTIEGESTIPTLYCAYIPLKGLQIEKAKGMMQNYTLLSDVLLKNQVTLNGTPFVEITQWDRATDSISYNFCFPIKRSEKLPILKQIKYKRIFEQPAIKAEYNGNYITSDRAWYALLDYAKENDISVEATPIEIFYNNPNMGGDELNWKAEIYMPIARVED